MVTKKQTLAGTFHDEEYLMIKKISASLLMILALPLLAVAQDCLPQLSTGQLIYVPSYSRTATGATKRTYQLSVTLSVHNVDPSRSIVLTEVNYYSTSGDLIRKYLKEEIRLTPHQTREFVIREIDNPGESGDNFMVRWRSDTPANPPLVESIFVGTSSGQGISLISRGVVVIE